MTPELTQFVAVQLVSASGVALLVALAWLFGFRGRARVTDETQVRALAQAARLPPPQAVAVDVRGRAALAEIDRETVFLVKAMGDRLTTRVFKRIAVAGVKMYRPKGAGIGARLRFSDAGFDDVRMEFREREAPAFVERLRRGARFS
ncbi:MAG: hypothetical protein NW200_08125 [Hyphomonadaceae bacterium]|nr:hypothetical protein [Hyphomonadaceae bacterium]